MPKNASDFVAFDGKAYVVDCFEATELPDQVVDLEDLIFKLFLGGIFLVKISSTFFSYFFL